MTSPGTESSYSRPLIVETLRARVISAMWEAGETWLGGKRKKRRNERVGPMAANPDNLDNNKEAGEEEQLYPGLK